MQNITSVIEGSPISAPALALNVSRVIANEDYDAATQLNDIALFKLAEPVTLTRHVQVACLPTTHSLAYPTPDTPAWTIGWGSTTFGAKLSNLLRKVKLTEYEGDKFCSRYEHTNWTSQICCGYYAGGRDTCAGDTGGGLYVYDSVGNKTKYVLAGIVSHGSDGIGCNRATFPGFVKRLVYADVDSLSAQII